MNDNDGVTRAVVAVPHSLEALSSLETESSDGNDHDVDAALRKLWRRVQTMRCTHRHAADHYRARHFWLSVVPIGAAALLAALLGLATAVDVSGAAHPFLSLSAGFCAAVALVLILVQAQSGSTGRSETHGAVERELCQVASRLETLGPGRGAPGSDTVRDLYRVDVYLQALQRCTPAVPRRIHKLYSSLASRLQEICIECPSIVQSLYDEESSAENPVPVDMHTDALDILGAEIESYLLYPLFVPTAKSTVERTIDIFFARIEGEGRNDGPFIQKSEESQYEESQYEQ